MHKRDYDSASRERLATILVVLIGLGAFVMSMFELRSLIREWDTSQWLNQCLIGTGWFILASISVAMILHPLRSLGVVSWIIRICLWPAVAIVWVGYYYFFAFAAFLTILALVVVPLLVVSSLQQLGLVAAIAEEVLYYSVIVAACFVFTYWGNSMVSHSLRLIEPKQDYSRLLLLLTPKLIRVYVYGLMAVAYVAANVEKFATVTLTTAQWWLSYKEVLVEVLLTYVSVDSVAVIWQEFQDERGK